VFQWANEVLSVCIGVQPYILTQMGAITPVSATLNKSTLCINDLSSTPIVYFGPSVDDQAVSLSDDGTTIIIEPYNQNEPAL
jgi:hypothetical protein